MPMKTPKLHYPMIQSLIKVDNLQVYVQLEYTHAFILDICLVHCRDYM